MPESRDGGSCRLLAEFPSGITKPAELGSGVSEGRRYGKDEGLERKVEW